MQGYCTCDLFASSCQVGACTRKTRKVRKVRQARQARQVSVQKKNPVGNKWEQMSAKYLVTVCHTLNALWQANVENELDI